MAWIKLNNIVSMHEKPVLGKVKSKTRYMALSVDKSTLKEKLKLGVAREITKSKGHPDIPGFIDESKLIIVKSKDLLSWEKVSDLKIKGINKITEKLSGKDKYLIGLEDPDIFIDEKGIKHIYFTIAFKYRNKEGYKIYLGHASGNTLENLKATLPVLNPLTGIDGFKESCISPAKNNGYRYALNEAIIIDQEQYSSISLSKVTDIGKEWDYKKIIFNPKKI